jgi:DNA polymerase
LAERAIPIQSNRGKVLDVPNGLRIFITIHPSALLRLQDEDEDEWRSAYASFVNDLRSVKQLAKMSAAETKADVRAAG